jgi:TRAP transporter 4TM/12TM fusion protein
MGASVPAADEAARLGDSNLESLEGVHARRMAGAPRPARVLAAVVAAAMTLATVGWSLDLLGHVGVALQSEQFMAAMLALSLALVFLAVPARRRRERTTVPWYDAALAALGFATLGYIAVRYPDLFVQVAYLPPDAIAVGAVAIMLVLEGLRRTVGLALLLVVVGFLAFALAGHLLPGQLQGRPVFADELVVYLAVDSNALLGRALYIAATIVVAFVLMGNLLMLSGGSNFFTDIAIALMGRYRGGGAKIAVLGSGLFGTISGSVVSNVASVGVVTIPLMRKGGYAAHQAGAIEATASTGGQLMPPIMGAAAFLMAEFLQVPYAEVALAAFIPAVLYYAALFIQIDLEAAKRGIRAAAVGHVRAWPVLRDGWIFVIPYAVLLLALFHLNVQPEEAALYAAASILPLGLLRGYRGIRIRLRDLPQALILTGFTVLDLMMIAAAAGIIIGVLNISGLGFGLTLALVRLGESNVVLLLLMSAGVCIVLGMGMPTTGVYILLAALVAPALIQVGINPMAAHMFILYFGMMSMITPPICVAAFAAATLAGSHPMRTGWTAVLFSWSAYIVPFLFVASPSLLLRGDAVQVVASAATAGGGVWLVSVGVVGYLAGLLGPVYRVAFGLSGLALMVPTDAYAGAILTNVVALLAGTVLIALRLRGKRKPASPVPEPSTEPVEAGGLPRLQP